MEQAINILRALDKPDAALVVTPGQSPALVVGYDVQTRYPRMLVKELAQEGVITQKSSTKHMSTYVLTKMGQDTIAAFSDEIASLKRELRGAEEMYEMLNDKYQEVRVYGGSIAEEAVENDGLDLNPSERKIFDVLKSKQGAWFRPMVLYEAINGFKDSNDPAKLINTYICRLRKKLKKTKWKITTKYTFGYCLEQTA